MTPAEASESDAKIDTETLKYDVELHFVFAFHESELELGQKNGVQDEIEKDLPLLTREVPPFIQISSPELPHHAYNFWGVLRGGRPPPVPYNLEPLKILERKLNEGCLV